MKRLLLANKKILPTVKKQEGVKSCRPIRNGYRHRCTFRYFKDLAEKQQLLKDSVCVHVSELIL